MDACLAAMRNFSTDLLASLLWAVGELGQVGGGRAAPGNEPNPLNPHCPVLHDRRADSRGDA